MTIRKIKASLVNIDIDDYICEDTYLFYDTDTGCIRMFDGTPGGKPACIEGPASSVEWGTIFGDISNQTDLSPRLVEQETATIPAGSTATVMTLTPTLNESLKYVISVVNGATGEFSSSEVLGVFKTLDNSVDYNWYSKVGDKIKYKPVLVYNSPDIKFQVINNEADPMTVSVSRISVISV